MIEKHSRDLTDDGKQTFGGIFVTHGNFDIGIRWLLLLSTLLFDSF